MLLVWLKGFLMGLAIAAPVGPIALLCIRRTLARGRWVGLLTGLGAATADGFYGVMVAFGLSAVSNLLVENARYLQLLGGAFLIYLGLTTFLAKPSVRADDLNAGELIADRSTPSASISKPALSSKSQLSTWLSAYSSTLALTLTNPATILSFIAIFASLGITQTSYLRSVTLVFGVFTGSAAWWLVLVSGVVYLRSRLTPEKLRRFNRWSTSVFGVLLVGFGVAALVA